MKHALLVACFIPAVAFSQVTFQSVIGTPRPEYANVVEQTSDGGYIVAGNTQYYTPGGQAYFLIKLDANGDTLWTRAYNSGGFDQLEDAQQTSDGGYILVGHTIDQNDQDIWIVKTTSNGTVSWLQRYGGTAAEWAKAVQQTSDGGYVVAGSYASGPGICGGILLKLTATGGLSWAKHYTLSTPDIVDMRAVMETSTGDLVFAAALEWYTTANPATELCVVKTDASGNILWAKTYGGNSRVVPFSILEAASGDYVVLGWRLDMTTGGTDDIWLLRMNTGGILAWSEAYETSLSGAIYGYDIQEDASGNFFVCGLHATSSGNYNSFLFRINGTGSLQWTILYGLESGLSGLDLTTDGGCIMSGSMWNAHAPGDSASIYIVKTDANGMTGCNEQTITLAQYGVPTAVATIAATLVPGSGTLGSTTSIYSGGATVIPICPVSVGEIPGGTTVSVFPNPFTENVTLDFGSTFSPNDAQLILTDLSGREVYRMPVTSSQVIIPRNDLASGVYIYRLLNNGQPAASGKLIAE